MPILAVSELPSIFSLLIWCSLTFSQFFEASRLSSAFLCMPGFWIGESEAMAGVS